MVRKSKDLTPKDPDFITSIERGVRVLGVFDRQHPELMLGEVAQRANLSPATARRFLMTFKALGYIGKNGRNYMLRSKVLELGFAYLNSMNVDEALQPYLLEMVQQTGYCTSITVLETSEIVFIASYAVGRIVRLSAVTGSRFPAHATAAGRVLLAHRTPEQLQAYFKTSPLRKLTSATETNVDVFKQDIENVRAKGYSIVPDELELGLVTVAVPIMGSAGNAIAAITCASVSLRNESEDSIRTRLVKPMQESARKVSAALARFPSLEHSVLSEDLNDEAPAEAIAGEVDAERDEEPTELQEVGSERFVD
jgi:IclR family pca regulon transcriptional regulator